MLYDELLKYAKENKDICIITDRATTLDLLSDMITECDIEILDMSEYDEISIFSKVDNLIIIESPFNRKTGELLYIGNELLMVDSRYFNKEIKLSYLDYEELIIF